MIRKSRMTNVSPCERYAPVKTAAEDYAMVILPLLVDTESEVSSRLNSTVCGETDKPVCEENGESLSIINMVCRRHFKLSSVPRAKHLTKEILTSLDCPCPSKQRQRGKEREGPAGGERGSGSGGGGAGRGEAGQRGEGGAGRGERGQRGGPGGAGRGGGHRDTRQLCRLKLALEGLKLCYQALASGHGPGT
ncbi:DEAD-box ATP-dependent RNA helicase rde-12-like [Osmerus eperlanus]|uniref:DEAD-box ATP-dependent RNA helicase rde-12-like n=1 Tax=Osmerus eperlanus TaxID=29151 RepID=UPI002E152BD6